MIDAQERALMDAAVRGALADAIETAGEGADVDAVLQKLGWLDLLRDEPDDAIAVVFGALGATNAVATALDDVLARALGQEPRVDRAVLLPRFAAWDPPGRIEGSDLQASGLATGRAARARELLVACRRGPEEWSAVLPVQVLGARRVHGVDPRGNLHALRVQGSTEGATRLDPGQWGSAVALGQRAVGHQIAGAGRAMLDLARVHAMERMQFGRPIARFQAVRHRLADALVALEALEAALTAARDEPSPDTAALVKAVAGRTARTVARHCQQVLAGVGFTTEHPFHRFLKRTMALEGLFGSADEIVLDVGRRLLATRRVPTLIEL
jgi:Acyl-CoA dehydrogenase, C-terminal domain